MTKHYWHHRISWGWPLSRRLLDKGYLTIGWPRCEPDKEAIEKAVRETQWEDFRSLVRRRYADWKGNYSLAYFFQMSPGDDVVVPLPGGEFAIADVASKAERIDAIDDAAGVSAKECEDVDLGFFVRVTDMVVLRRIYADDVLQCGMAARRRTTLCIDGLGESVNRARNGVRSSIRAQFMNMPGLTKQVVMACQGLTPNNFERLVAAYMTSIGASTVKILARNDSRKRPCGEDDEIRMDADVVAYFRHLGIAIYVQAKKHEGETGQQGVDQISKYVKTLGSILGKDDRDAGDETYKVMGWVVTSAESFSDEARRLADGNGIRLVDGRQFAEMLLDAGLAGLPMADADD